MIAPLFFAVPLFGRVAIGLFGLAFMLAALARRSPVLGRRGGHEVTGCAAAPTSRHGGAMVGIVQESGRTLPPKRRRGRPEADDRSSQLASRAAGALFRRAAEAVALAHLGRWVGAVPPIHALVVGELARGAVGSPWRAPSVGVCPVEPGAAFVALVGIVAESATAEGEPAEYVRREAALRLPWLVGEDLATSAEAAAIFVGRHWPLVTRVVKESAARGGLTRSEVLRLLGASKLPAEVLS